MAGSAAAPEAIGPGRLVLVVGPSGAGKDTLINAVREACAQDPAVVFPRRIVTRAASAHEDHDSSSEADFKAAEAAGAFALSWRAHGLSYGLPRSMDGDIRRGRTVVCNVSRTIVASARMRYEQALAVLVTVPPEILAARLTSRGRASDGPLDARLKRSASVGVEVVPDFVVDNSGALARARDQLLDIVKRPNFIVSA